MRKLLLFLVFLPLLSVADNGLRYSILEHTASYDIVKIEVGEMQFFNVYTPNGLEKRISIDGGSQIIEKGAPDLPKLSFSLIVPNQKDGRIEVLSTDYTDFPNIKVAPSKGKIYRDEDPDDYAYVYGDYYQQNKFYPSQLASLQNPYVMRDFRGQSAHIFPVKYNPISKTLRKYDEIIIKVHYDQPASKNILPNTNHQIKQVQTPFDQIYSYQFLNYKTLSGYNPLPQVGSMLILCPAKYQPAIQDFVAWKERKGYKVYLEISDTITGGATEPNLKSLVTQYYNQKQIAYLLIVGDATDIPAQNSYYTIPGLWGPSDIAYAYQSGSDHYPEFIVGRFSADTLPEVITQVKRTILYETQPNTNSTWMHKQVAIGSDQGPGDKGQYDHEHLRGIADSNKNFGNYVYNYEFFDGTHGGNDAPGAPPVNSLGDAINDGIGLINYCGHGSTDIFITSTFIGASQMPTLTNNNGMWPFIFSTACRNGQFVYSTCLGEHFLRAADSLGNPKGAIAAIMSSINQSWDPPMQGQDEMNALLRHDRPGTYQTTFGAITASGIMSTIDHYNTPIDPGGGDEIADTWIVFADPTVELYTKNQGALTCTHNTTIGQGSTSFEVICAEENAQIGLYYQGEYLASAIVQAGKANFTFPAVLNLDTILVTATKQNFLPYSGNVEVVIGTPFGLEDLAKENIKIFPNPAIDYLNISDADNKIKSVELIDINGKILLSTEEKNINVSLLASGIYTIRLALKDKVITTKFSKQ